MPITIAATPKPSRARLLRVLRVLHVLHVPRVLRIGQTLGDKLLVIGSSTGATLATWKSLRSDGQDVAAQRTRDVFARIASAHKTAIVVDYSESIGQHVLAGDIRAPKATATMADSIVQWVRSLP